MSFAKISGILFFMTLEISGKVRKELKLFTFVSTLWLNVVG